MGERKEIKITTVEAKRQMDIIAQLSQHIKDKNLKFCISTFGCGGVKAPMISSNY